MKKSFSMVELLFAIIIIALAIGALPSVVKQVNESTNISINQEAIWMATSVLYNIMDYRWDENSKGDGTEGRKAIQVSSAGDPDFAKAIEPRFRIGHVREDLRRSFFTDPIYSGFQASAIGKDGVENITYDSDRTPTLVLIDDMDDFDGYDGRLSQTNFRSRLRYKKEYRMGISVSYIDDSNDPNGNNIDYRNSDIVTFKLNPNNSVTGTTNIKLIEIDVKDCDDDFAQSAFKLKAFSCNIGEYLDLTNKVN